MPNELLAMLTAGLTVYHLTNTWPARGEGMVGQLSMKYKVSGAVLSLNVKGGVKGMEGLVTSV